MRGPWARRLTGAALGGYLLLMFAATHYPKPEQISPQVSDKLLHFCAYAGLAVLVVAALHVRRRLGWRALGLTALGCAVYGALDELLQIPVGRHCDLWDWVADMGGVAAVLAVAGFYLALRSGEPKL